MRVLHGVRGSLPLCFSGSRSKAPIQKPPYNKPRYKSTKKTRDWIFFLGLVDPSQNRLASTAYFTIISLIILTGLLSGSFCPVGFCLGGSFSEAFDRLPWNQIHLVVFHCPLYSGSEVREGIWNQTRFNTSGIEFMSREIKPRFHIS